MECNSSFDAALHQTTITQHTTNTWLSWRCVHIFLFLSFIFLYLVCFALSVPISWCYSFVCLLILMMMTNLRRTVLTTKYALHSTGSMIAHCKIPFIVIVYSSNSVTINVILRDSVLEQSMICLQEMYFMNCIECVLCC